MNLKTAFAAVILILSPMVAQAGVIYEWRASNGLTPWGVSLQLEFDQATVDSGAFSLSYVQSPGPNITPLDGLLGVYYSTLAYPSHPLLYQASSGGFPRHYGFIFMQVQFNPGGYLEGTINIGDDSQHVEMASSGALFTVLDANHDGGMEDAGCQTLAPCSGAQGVLEAVAASEVAEPLTLGLLGVGGMGLMAARRRSNPRMP